MRVKCTIAQTAQGGQGAGTAKDHKRMPIQDGLKGLFSDESTARLFSIIQGFQHYGSIAVLIQVISQNPVTVVFFCGQVITTVGRSGQELLELQIKPRKQTDLYGIIFRQITYVHSVVTPVRVSQKAPTTQVCDHSGTPPFVYPAQQGKAFRSGRFMHSTIGLRLTVPLHTVAPVKQLVIREVHKSRHTICLGIT